MNILFLCKYNRFRSKVAENYFNKINKNKNNVAQSAGFIIDSSPQSDIEVNTAKKLGLVINQNPNSFQKMTHSLLNWADIIVIVADDVLKDNIENTNAKILSWGITDIHNHQEQKVENIINLITTKVDDLIFYLNSKNQQ